jgi:hypothetical protein
VLKHKSIPFNLDWIFDIPDLYQDCNLPPADCQANGASLIHAFNKFVDAPNELTVTCVPQKNRLPDWVWSQVSIFTFRILWKKY